MSRTGDRSRRTEAALKTAVEAHVEGNLAGAEEGYRAAADLGDPDAAFQLGVILDDRGDYAGAAVAYEQAAESGHPEATLNLALLYAGALRRPEDAQRLLAYAAGRGDRRAMFELGYLHWRHGDPAAAAAAFRAAIDAGDARGYLELGFLLADAGRQDDALAAFEEAASRGVPEAWTQAGWQLARLGRLVEAEAALRRASDLGHHAGDDLLADVLEKLGRTEEEAIVRKTALDWADACVSLEYRKLMFDLIGEDADADGFNEWIAEEKADDLPIELAALMYDAARLSEAETRLRLAIEYSDDDEARANLEQLLRLTGRGGEADELSASRARDA